MPWASFLENVAATLIGVTLALAADAYFQRRVRREDAVESRISTLEFANRRVTDAMYLMYGAHGDALQFAQAAENHSAPPEQQPEPLEETLIHLDAPSLPPDFRFHVRIVLPDWESFKELLQNVREELYELMAQDLSPATAWGALDHENPGRSERIAKSAQRLADHLSAFIDVLAEYHRAEVVQPLEELRRHKTPWYLRHGVGRPAAAKNWGEKLRSLTDRPAE